MSEWAGHFFQERDLLSLSWQPIQGMATEDGVSTQERLGFKIGSKELVSLKDCSKQTEDPRLMYYFISLTL